MKPTIDKSTAILNAAARRFRRDGFTKTSLADIAADCSISMAHIYNFYDSKIALACAVVEGAVEEIIATIEMGIAQEAPATEQMTQALLLEFDTTYRFSENNTGFLSCLNAVSEKRAEFWGNLLRRLRGPLTAILRNGRDTGVFPLRDPARTAELVQTAMMPFRFPQRLGPTRQARLRADCFGVVELLVYGVTGR
ncbi:TetR/AcrR family transcriptional regulator [Breoghania sp. L-A4]|uniref:TetR/AcrR family transcriptional regulator n=1 Tax=Breoghania sp. L-A4 TaxID=2304600 RepID=UPI000E360450|nr:TetR/AcrR family transcriptional regulator [Breoghania sp. L-A4]AXS39031.1 TetR/AcrR family transcriptional regulator [Breoghania sp. L-A4]